MKKVAQLKLASSNISNAQFLTALFDELDPHEVIWWAHFRGNHKTSGEWSGEKVKPSEVSNVTDENTFYTPATFDNSGGNASRRSDFVSRLFVLVFDDITDLDDLPLPPTYAIETSKGSYHVGYRIQEPLLAPEAEEFYREVLTGTMLKHDKSGNILNRYVRLPCGFNIKSQHHQHLAIWSPQTTYDKYTLLAHFAGDDPTYKAPSNSSWEGVAVEIKKLRRNKDGQIMNGGRKEFLRRAIHSMVMRGDSLDRVEKVLYGIVTQFDDSWADDDIENTRKAMASSIRKARAQHKEVISDTPEVDDSETRANIFQDFPPRQWALKPIIPKNCVTTLIAPGGTGKSAMVALLAGTLAAGTAFPGCDPEPPKRVVVVTYEDDKSEYERKLAALWANGALGKDPTFVERVHIIDMDKLDYEDKKTWATSTFGRMEITGFASVTTEMLKTLEPDVVIFETLSLLNGVDESNEAFTLILSCAKAMCVELNASIVITHHQNKMSQTNETIDQTVGRGGSSLADNARSVLQLMKMSDKKAKALWPDKDFEQLERDFEYMVALVHTKSNYAKSLEPRLMLRVPDPRIDSFVLKEIDVEALPEKVEKLDDDINAFTKWVGEYPKNITTKVLKLLPADQKPVKRNLITFAEKLVELGHVRWLKYIAPATKQPSKRLVLRDSLEKDIDIKIDTDEELNSDIETFLEWVKNSPKNITRKYLRSINANPDKPVDRNLPSFADKVVTLSLAKWIEFTGKNGIQGHKLLVTHKPKDDEED
jgi:hypothetical protein